MLTTPLLGLAIVAVTVWLMSGMFRKAGFSPWAALVVPFTGYIGLIVFALIEWPVERELGWLRVAAGEFSEQDAGLALSHAGGLERRGEARQAIKVYEELAKRLRDPQEVEYARSCAARLGSELSSQ